MNKQLIIRTMDYQEGFASQDIIISFKCELSDVGQILIDLKTLDNTLENSSNNHPYPILVEGSDTFCTLDYVFNLNNFSNDNNPSILFNIVSIFNSYLVFSLAKLFRSRGFEILNFEDLKPISDRDIAVNTCNKHFNSLLSLISHILSETEQYLFYTTKTSDYYSDKEIELIPFNENREEFLEQFENKDINTVFMDVLKEETPSYSAEYFISANNDEETFPLKEFNPFSTSDKYKELILNSELYEDYKEVIDYFYKNILKENT